MQVVVDLAGNEEKPAGNQVFRALQSVPYLLRGVHEEFDLAGNAIHLGFPLFCFTGARRLIGLGQPGEVLDRGHFPHLLELQVHLVN